MQPVSLGSIDLNLLRVLDALLSERSVTRAARSVGLSQSAMSHALSRLREHFDDPLFVRTTNGMEPTPRASLMAPALREAMGALHRALDGSAVFDPSTTKQTVRLSAADYAEFLLLPELMARFDREAPGLQLWVHTSPGGAFGPLLRSEMDLALVVLRAGSAVEGIETHKLFSERFVCIVRKGHPLTRGTLTLERFSSARHAFIAPGGTRGGPVDDLLAALGHERFVALAVPHFLVAPHVVANSELVLTVGERVARAFARHLPLTMLEPPLEIQGFTLSLAWAARRSTDPALRWVREQIIEVASRTLGAPSKKRKSVGRKAR